MQYSIIIPIKNGAQYARTCINSVLEQDYSDFELIVSVDESTDNSLDIVRSISDSRLVTLVPPPNLSMAEHWEWALDHSRGQWVMFLGQDDALQHYFFRHADRLVAQADQNRIRAIMSSRAYYFWPGCEFHYGNTALSYNARPISEILSTRTESFATLLGTQIYFELPQMYTNSIFKMSLLNEIKAKQDNHVFVTHPQDANLAAALCRIEDLYLKSHIPLGWIGTSPKSAGLAISMTPQEGKDELTRLRKNYEATILKSKLPYHPWAGSFALGSHLVYFWQALVQTENLDHARFTFIKSKFFRTFFFALVWLNMPIKKRSLNRTLFLEALESNRISPILCIGFRPAAFFAKILTTLIRKSVWRLHNQRYLNLDVSVDVKYSENNQVDLLSESRAIAQTLNKLQWV